MRILKVLIYAKEDQLPLLDGPLLDGSTKRQVSIDVLRGKNVLLLISDLDLSHELFILHHMYTESRTNPTRQESRYEVVWLPVVDITTPWNEEKKQKFEEVQGMMPWYSVYEPSLDPKVIKYIKEVWHFNKKPLLVVLDPQRRVVNPNAIHMMWIWGNVAFPFTSQREEALWKTEAAWTIELLADSIDQSILNWIADKKYICLYGGEDIDWIRRFTNAAQAVAQAAGIPLEMMYVGTSNPSEKIQQINNIILAEKLSHILPDPSLIWFFWVRLESMWHSKMQHGMSVENDPIMQEIVTVLSFDGSDQGWAMICRGTKMATAKGDTILKSLTQFENWKNRVGEVGFVTALNDDLCGLHTPHHCHRLILPGSTKSIPKVIFCADCGFPMEMFIMYRCCID